MPEIRPRISIVTPVFNGAAYIRQCIESVLSQGYDNIEHIVVDDGSTDSTRDIAGEFDHIKFLQQNRQGAPAARNAGLEACTGDYCKFLDADDFMMEQALVGQIDLACNAPSGVITFGYALSVDDQGRVVNQSNKDWDGDAALVDIIGSNILTTLPLYPVQAVRDINGFDVRLSSRQEWNLNIRLARAGWRFRFDNVFVYTQRYHDAAHRISNRRLNGDDELQNLEYAIEPLLSTDDEEVLAATAAYVWATGRRFIYNDMESDAHLFFERARVIYGGNFLKHFTLKYRVMKALFGPVYADVISRSVKRVAAA